MIFDKVNFSNKLSYLMRNQPFDSRLQFFEQSISPKYLAKKKELFLKAANQHKTNSKHFYFYMLIFHSYFDYLTEDNNPQFY